MNSVTIPSLIIALAIVAGAVTSIYSDCPADQISINTPQTEKENILKSVSAQGIDESCLAAMMEKLKKDTGKTTAERFIEMIGQWTDRNEFSLPLLCRSASMCFVEKNPDFGKRLVKAWERKNGPVIASLAGFASAGALFREDSLFIALDRCIGRLTGDQLMQWAHVREVLGGYRGSAELYGRAVAVDPRVLGSVYVRLFQSLDNAPDDSVAAALSLFQQGALRYVGIGFDTLGLQRWLADFYDRHNLDEEEICILEAIPGTVVRLTPRLLDMARLRYDRRLFTGAIPPAKAVYERTDNAQLKAAGADILYKAFRETGKVDSSISWLRKTGIAGESRRADAVVLYQLAGRLQEAQAFIDMLHPSFNRDTLEVRQLLFSGDTAKAAAMVANSAKTGGGTWVRFPNETLLWRVRTLLFRRLFEDLTALFDSVPLPVAWSGAQELVNHRYRLQVFKKSSADLEAWSEVEYELFLGKPEQAWRNLAARSIRPESKAPLLLRVVGELVAEGKIEAAAAVFKEQGEPIDSPEYLYRYAEVLFDVGHPEQVQPLLIRVLRDYPGDVFSEKARVLLAKVRGTGNP